MRILEVRNLVVVLLVLLVSSAFVLDSVSNSTLAAFTIAATHGNSTLSTTSFSLTGTSAGAALFSITDALPGQYVEKDVTVTTLGKGNLTLSIAQGSVPGVQAPLSNASPDDRALMVRVEQCGSSFAQAGCTGMTGLNGGSTAGVANGGSLTSSNSVTFNAAAAAGAVTLQTAQPSGSYYYKVLLKIPVNTTSGGSNSDNTFANTSVKITTSWQLTSVAGSLRSTP